MSAIVQRPTGDGVYRRRILLRAAAEGVVADLEDDFHRFRVVLVHDGDRVVEARGEALRFPWSECPGAVEPLRALAGMPLCALPSGCAAHTNPRANCTHLFDLAGLAVGFAHAGHQRRQLDIAVPEWSDGRTRPSLQRDGELLLRWEVHGTHIAAPEPWAGRSLRGGAFLRWVETELDVESAEAAIALRRACFIAAGRSHDLDAAADASVYLPLTPGSCHTFTPGVAERAKRMVGTSLDFTHHPERLLADAEA